MAKRRKGMSNKAATNQANKASSPKFKPIGASSAGMKGFWKLSRRSKSKSVRLDKTPKGLMSAKSKLPASGM